MRRKSKGFSAILFSLLFCGMSAHAACDSMRGKLSMRLRTGKRDCARDFGPALDARKNQLLVVLRRGRHRLEVRSPEVLASLAGMREFPQAQSQAAAYWVLARSVDLEPLSRGKRLDEIPASRELYLSRLCRLCESGEPCALRAVTWDPLVDTRSAAGRDLERSDPLLQESYESFSVQGGVWRFWPGMLYPSADHFLMECRSRRFPQLEWADQSAWRFFSLHQIYKASNSDPTRFARLFYQRFVRPVTYEWSGTASSLGLDFHSGQDWVQGLSAVDPQTLVQILAFLHYR